jgi:hypothetical protein
MYYEFRITDYPNPYFVVSQDNLDGEIINLKSEQTWWPNNNELNSMVFSPQANYTDRTTAACRRS